jgi:hypothetical protein
VIGATCPTCRFFDNAVDSIEAAFPGLKTMSSAHASVRADDGLCSLHDRYVASASTCSAHRPRMAAAVTSLYSGATSTRQS